MPDTDHYGGFEEWLTRQIVKGKIKRARDNKAAKIKIHKSYIYALWGWPRANGHTSFSLGAKKNLMHALDDDPLRIRATSADLLGRNIFRYGTEKKPWDPFENIFSDLETLLKVGNPIEGPDLPNYISGKGISGPILAMYCVAAEQRVSRDQ